MSVSHSLNEQGRHFLWLEMTKEVCELRKRSQMLSVYEVTAAHNLVFVFEVRTS
jgi:hypothetical protein